MDIKLRKLSLEAINLVNKDHRIALNRASGFDGVRYVSSNIMNLVKEPDRDDVVVPGGTYILKHGEDDIGILGTKELDVTGVMELWCLINPSERNKGYATKTLEEVTPYLIENIQRLNDIKLVINKNNYSSKRTAVNAGYKKMDSNPDVISNEEEYRYFGK